ncbi:hypothetical protein K470DRAFT_239056 [Piedraia hortae CBS 480.64]|uniref:Inner centromere protein ARK-binding domain-containing protein n=1 Tax=Piedraia hortae CBS 480.64 TaxID=1314780 RepID=A0A6A7CAG7_9PEZI|nr:hypothetical protein K470DRAFT_239056 [Piedraia hortae CBS 480.64]
MATGKPKRARATIGSTQWVQDELTQHEQFIEQDIEDFKYGVRFELEWLNEKIIQALNQDGVKFADMLKTPGRFLGKTPRTAYRQRQPLTDVFAAPTVQPVLEEPSKFSGKIARVQMAENAENIVPVRQLAPPPPNRSPRRTAPAPYTDSGYHGMHTEDEMDVDKPQQSTASDQATQSMSDRPRTATTDGILEESFLSAKEVASSRRASHKDAEMVVVQSVEPADVQIYEDQMEVDGEVDKDEVMGDAVTTIEDSEGAESSPEKTVQRKSSIAFSALPAREHSMGPRVQENIAREEVENSEDAQVRSKRTTQSLHERIKMLGESRQSKSIAQSIFGAQAAYPQLHLVDTEAPKTTAPALAAQTYAFDIEDDDEWIAPSKTLRSRAAVQPARPTTPPLKVQKAREPSASPPKPQTPAKVQTPTALQSPAKPQSVTTQQSPVKASFTPVESTTPAGSPMARRIHDGPLSASKSKLWSAFKSAKSIFASSANVSAAAKMEAANTPVMQRFGEESVAAVDEPMQGPERPQTASSNASSKKREREEPEEPDSDKKRRKSGEPEEEAAEDEMPPPPQPKSSVQGGKLRAPAKLKKPAAKRPVNVKVASQASRVPGIPTSVPQAAAKNGPRVASAQGNAKAPGNARVKALEAAARKKEADERAAQKKLEQKRALEAKRAAAKAEEERRVEEERKAAEQQRIQEAKLAAQRKAEQMAAEARKRELQHQKQLEENQRVKNALDVVESIKREQTGRGGTLRSIGKGVQPNPVKPVKRVHQDEDDETVVKTGTHHGISAYQQADGKRRRTNEEDERHINKPPMRPSNNPRMESTLSKFPPHAPPPAAHHVAKQGKAPVHPSQTVQMSTARIPFAESVNGGNTLLQPAPGHESTKYKTPARPAQTVKSMKPLKSSPAYPQGENIELPDILTDSEEEDSEEDEVGGNGGFRAPSWAASPALRNLLLQQQLIDPETVFGPIAPLKMEEVFRNGTNQERLKRFRQRGSSALWVETGDAVTSAEKRKDMQMRERVVKEGGWRFHAE